MHVACCVLRVLCCARLLELCPLLIGFSPVIINFVRMASKYDFKPGNVIEIPDGDDHVLCNDAVLAQFVRLLLYGVNPQFFLDESMYRVYDILK